MFREMRRIKNQMSDKSTLDLLKNTSEGVLGTISDNGYPYTVVVNYVLYQDKIYFHSAKTGHKIDNIMANSKVSFTVYGNEKVIQEEFTTKFQSVTLFGHAKIIPGNKEVLMELIKKYSPDFLETGTSYVNKQFTSTILVEVTIDHITSKERL